MNWSAGKIGTINQRPACANGLSTPPIGCGLHLLGLPGGGSKIYDRSPYGNIGTITGATWVRLPSGLWVLSFDGTDDYVNCGNDASFDITSAITIEAWVKSDPSASLNQPVVAKWKTGQSYYLFVGSSASSLVLSLPGGTQSVSSDTIIFGDDTWHQLLGTYDGGHLRTYLDGALDCTPVADTGDITISAEDAIIGRGESALVRKFLGLIALPRIYNRALSALEIQNHFNREKHLFGVW